jgi:predicted Zn-dependent protease
MNRMFPVLLLTLAASFGWAPQPAYAQLPGLRELTDKLEKAKRTTDETAQKVQQTADDAGHVAKGVQGVTLQEEVAIGDAVAIAIVQRYGGVWKDEAATHRVNLVGRVLARYATRQDLQWRFGLLDSDAINAFSAPGGRVFITRALYQLVRGDDELAGVLAHEVMHIDQRHALASIERSELLTGVSGLLEDSQVDVSGYESLVTEVAEQLLVSGLEPAAEYDADARGRNLAALIGFAPGGLRAVLTEIQASSSGSPEVFSTHPPIDSRLSRLPADPPLTARTAASAFSSPLVVSRTR